MDLNCPIETKQEYYYKTPVKQDDIELVFKKLNIRLREQMNDKWCAFVGDSMTVVSGVLNNESSGYSYIGIYVNDELRIQGTSNASKSIRLHPEKNVFTYKQFTFIPLKYDGNEMLIYYTSDNTGIIADGCHFVCIWDTYYDLLVTHNKDYNYSIRKLGDLSASFPFYPKYLDAVATGWGTGSWHSFGGDMEFENDGTIEMHFSRVDNETPKLIYQIHLTREAMYELEINDNKVKRKYWNIVDKGTDHAIYEFVVEYPNGHEYHISFGTQGEGNNNFRTASISYMGEKYQLTPEYSELPCRFINTNPYLWHENGPYGKFTEVNFQEDTGELRFYDGDSELFYPIVDGYDYLLGQNNCLIIGATNLYLNVNGFPELDNEVVFHRLFIYDGICPNCIDNKSKMQIDFNESITKCTQCNRWYDLNNHGVIIKGNEGKRLIRYPAKRTDKGVEINQ